MKTILLSLLLALVTLGGPRAQAAGAAGTPAEFHDEFGGYADGSQAAPAWRVNSAFWETHSGRLIAEDRQRSFAILTNTPPGRAVSIEATVVASNACVTAWKIAGVGVYHDEFNFWHLALVEAPDANGANHFLELSEMRDGTWNAQSEPATRLDVLDGDGRGLNWKIGAPYRLRVELAADRIRGTVTDEKGQVLARLAYRLDPAKAVTAGYAMLDDGGFVTAFDDVAATVAEPVELPMPAAISSTWPPCDLAGVAGVHGTSNGFFHVEAVEDRSWLVTPRGEGFFAVGVDHVNFNAHWCETLGYAPYHRNVERLFGTEENWATSSVQRLKCWGFNSLGAGLSPSVSHRGLAHTAFLSFGSEFSGYSDIVPKINWTGFPNVFDPRFARFCDWRAAAVGDPERDDPWLLGYFLDNELEWYGKSGREEGLFEEAFKKPPTHTAKEALVGLLEQRHKTIQALNMGWGTSFAEWAAVRNATNPPPATAMLRADAAAFVGLCAERYFAVTCAAVRRHDPHHLILGCRFAGRAPDPAWRACGRSGVDVVSVNIYPRVNLYAAQVLEAGENLQRWYEWTGKPLMVTEWSFPALDAGLPCRHGAGMRVDTQLERTLCCAVMQDELFRLPCVVGSDFFMWSDEPAPGISATFPEDSNYGLVNETNQPYPLLTAMFASLNSEVGRLHSGALPRGTPIAGLQQQFLARTHFGETPARPRETSVVQFRRTTAGYEVDNGALKLVKDTPGGNVFDRVIFRGTEMGRYAPLIWQKVPENVWTAPDAVADVRDSRLADGSLQLDVTEQKGGDFGFQVACRYVILPGANWFKATLVTIENTGRAEWTLAGYYHYASSNIGGDPADDTVSDAGVPDYWRPFAAWHDAAAGLYYGVVADPVSDVRVTFWKDETGREHPDALRPVDMVLKPGTRYAAVEPPMYIFAVAGVPDEHPWRRVLAETAWAGSPQ